MSAELNPCRDQGETAIRNARNPGALFRPVRYFPMLPVPSAFTRKGPVFYRCDSCKTVTRYENQPLGGPGPCACGALSIDQFPIKPVDSDGFLLPLDAGPGVADPNRLPVLTCEPCPYWQCWHKEPTRTCGLGLGQTSYWGAGENRIIRPAFSLCFDNAARLRGEGEPC
jgi:hypothetical protein